MVRRSFRIVQLIMLSALLACSDDAPGGADGGNPAIDASTDVSRDLRQVDAPSSADAPQPPDAPGAGIPQDGPPAGTPEAGQGGNAPSQGLTSHCGCGAGMKVCKDFEGTSTCVASDDPRFGCGQVGCTSCSGGANTIARCAAGQCAFECAPGFGDCNGTLSDGCEVNLRRDGYCGACGRTCPQGEVCGPNGCVPSCPVPYTACARGCENLSTSQNSCGSCFQACGSGARCVAGKCEIDCPAPSVVCNGRCVDPTSDPSNCGGCGRSCARPNAFAACVSGQCTIKACQIGYTRLGDACLSLASDPEHCGQPGRSCAGGVCIAGSCDAPAIIADGIAEVTSLAVDTDWIYWTDATLGKVTKAPKRGGAQIPVAADQAKPSEIAVDACAIFWTNPLGAAVMRARKAGGAPEVLAQANGPSKLRLDDTHAYWIEEGVLFKVPKAGGARGPALTYPNPPNSMITFALDKDYFYFTVGRRMRTETMRLGRNFESLVSLFVSLSDTRMLFADATHLFGSATEGFGTFFRGVFVRAIPGDPPETAQAGNTAAEGHTVDMASDATHVYWRTANGDVFALPKCGGSVVKLFANSGPKPGTQLEVEGGAVYFDDGGSIRRIGALGPAWPSTPAACPR